MSEEKPVLSIEEIKDILKKVRSLLSKRNNWIPHTMAKNEEGLAVLSKSPEAVKWCAVGAINKNLTYEGHSHIVQQFVMSHASNRHRYLTDVNDVDGYAIVMELLETAINSK